MEDKPQKSMATPNPVGSECSRREVVKATPEKTGKEAPERAAYAVAPDGTKKARSNYRPGTDILVIQ